MAGPDKRSIILCCPPPNGLTPAAAGDAWVWAKERETERIVRGKSNGFARVAGRGVCRCCGGKTAKKHPKITFGSSNSSDKPQISSRTAVLVGGAGLSGLDGHGS